jgi:hypothetical protein
MPSMPTRMSEHLEGMREIKPDQLASTHNYMQEYPMNGDDMTKTLGSGLTRLTCTVSLWGGAITILLAIILVLSGTPMRGHGPRATGHRPSESSSWVVIGPAQIGRP